jgi:tetratricopeptide (TPR) repeat protein
MTHTPTSHLWLQGEVALQSWSAAAPSPSLGVYDGDRRLRGAYTAAGSLLRAKIPALIDESPDLAQRHDLEILVAAPELGAVLTNTRRSLTSEADPQTRTRYYPHNRINWIGNGLTDLVLQVANDQGPGQVLVITNVDQLDPTDNDWLAGLVRRSNPENLQVVLASRTTSVSGPLGPVLARFASSDGVPDAPGSPSPYDELVRKQSPEWHDAEADRLEALGEQSLMLGAVLYHRERGTEPARAAAAISAAMQTCLMVGFYDQVVELGKRVAPLLPWEDDEEARWLSTVKMTIAYQAMGMPDEAMELFDDACANSLLPSVHMQSAYGRAMVYTRYYEEERRDLRKAKGLVNTAVALAGLSSDAQRRAYNRTFNENGLALIDMHMGNLDDAVELIEGGIARLDSEVEAGRFLLHRSVLRYNHAQLMVRTASLGQALAEYDAIIEEDPNHPDYYFDRAGLLVRAGRDEDAIADYTSAVTVGPPYAEPYYNRGEILMRLGDLDGAVRDFSRVLDLDPTFVDAYVNRASLLFEGGYLDDAEDDIREGLALAANQPHLLCLSGLIHQAEGRLDEARTAYEAALATDSELAGAWANLGIVRFEQGHVAEARECFERSLVIEDDETVRANLGVALAA